MEEKNKKLEEFFRSQFNETEKEIHLGEWNTPPPESWDNIKLALHDKHEKDRNPKTYWKWLGLIVGLILIAFLGHYYSLEKIKNKHLRQELESSKQLIAGLVRQPNIKESNQSVMDEEGRKIDLMEDDKVQNKEASITAVNKTKKISQELSTYSAGHSQNTINTGKRAFDSHPSNHAAQNAFSHNSINPRRNDLVSSSPINLPMETEIQRNLIDGSEIRVLDKSDIHKLVTQINLNQHPGLILIENEAKRLKFYLGFEAGSNYKIRERPSFSTRPGIPENSFVFENDFNSQNVGLKAGYNMSKDWSIEGGLSYMRSDININHNRLLALSNLEEIKDRNGNYIGIFNFDIPTSSGGISTDVVSSRSSTTSLDPNELINVGINLDNRINQLSIPIAIRYSTELGPLIASIRAGVVNSWITNNDLKINNINSSNEDLHFQSRGNQIENRPNGVSNKYRLNYLVGAGLDYSLPNNWSLYFEPTFSQSTTPLVDEGRLKAFNKQLSFNAGIKKYL